MTKDELKEIFKESPYYDDLVVVGEYYRGFLYTDGYENLKQLYFDKACDLWIDNLYLEKDGDYMLNEEVYNDLTIQDIKTDVQQVLTGDDIIDHIVDTDPEEDYFKVQVSINGGYDYVKIDKDYIIK